ncbi:cell wall-active antibiotics response protein LiaF [Paenibacillus larvae]|uniref:Uncharacterized protein n=4 Tax=Paenibacillus larvae TaxID=1464 RepID=A0A1V0URS3_9BACL|nr:cell wall-active antibiotics response protein LiaF [Paenibacillus larvae]AHD06843.1 putative membrane protein [Paenibacillus larvae subsp. larvae DSM 25430]AQR76315.1 hypothetical protein BXP28_01855 [Paenibacillus larvae subsp. larvae]AQT84354.1 hypothetical protein B1222_07985 [Paenibacillus larvae subsp. pulvifaciens]AQZ46342.1 hypothetical protein B5S25_06560 [Paenibacillus larvae subsp. pulvifaciens]ARF67672.1 hypothetical protein B7C51_07225 [Paenibacillus larvae subsp. pulvifaciens]
MEKEESAARRKRNTAFLFIGAGIFLILERQVGFFSVIAFASIVFGIYRIWSQADKKGYLLVIIGVFFIFGDRIFLLIAVIFISLGYFYLKSQQLHRHERYEQRQRVIDSIRLGSEPWVLRDSSIWFVIGELNMDLSTAILEQKETTLVLQGLIGNVNLIIPEDVGASVSASVMIGQASVYNQKETGVWNKVNWTSPNYETSDQQVKLVLSYLVGDIQVRVF